MHQTYPYIPSTLILVLLHNWTGKKIPSRFSTSFGGLFPLLAENQCSNVSWSTGKWQFDSLCTGLLSNQAASTNWQQELYFVVPVFFFNLLLLFSHCYLRIKAFSVHAIYISENKHWHLYLPLLSVQEYQLQTPTFVWFVIWIISNLINITKVRVLFNGIMFTSTVGYGTQSTVLISPGEFEVADVACCFFLSKRTNVGA